MAKPNPMTPLANWIQPFVAGLIPMNIRGVDEQTMVRLLLEARKVFGDVNILRWSLASGLRLRMSEAEIAKGLGITSTKHSEEELRRIRAISPWSAICESPPSGYAVCAAARDWVKNRTNATSSINILFMPDIVSLLAQDPRATRVWREELPLLKISNIMPIFFSCEGSLPQTLEHEFYTTDFPSLPEAVTESSVSNTLRALIGDGVATPHTELAKALQGRVPELVLACHGLTLIEITNIIRSSVAASVEAQNTPADVLRRVLLHKGQQVSRSGALSLMVPGDMGDVGGLDTLKRWIEERAWAFTPEATSFGLVPPRGVVLVGPPGTGKSLVAASIASALGKVGGGLSLVRLDVGALYGSLVGQTEEQLRRALRTVEGLGRVVLWVDEVEKALGSGEHDGGVAKRLLGTLLTWLSDRVDGKVFVVVTANDVRGLPPELLRKGRFDEIFYIDLPSIPDRAAILEIMLRKRKRSMTLEERMYAAQAAHEFSGAELEQIVKDAMYSVFAERRISGDNTRDLTSNDLVKAINATKPAAKINSERITALREWARVNARHAGAIQDEITTPASTTPQVGLMADYGDFESP